MKKISAILLSAMLLLSLFAGCGKQSDIPSPTNETLTTPISAGMLVFNAGAAVNISYDSDGLVINLEGADNAGTMVVGAYAAFLGKPVAEAVCDLIDLCAVSNYLSAETGFVLLKLAYGSAQPGVTFIETIRDEAVAAVKEYSPAKVFFLTKADLDSNGYINLDSAKALLLAHLGLESFDTLEGTITPMDGMYSFAVTAGDMDERFIVDAVTGSVGQGELLGVDYGDMYLGDELDFSVPTEETFPTEDLSVPAAPEDPTDIDVAE